MWINKHKQQNEIILRLALFSYLLWSGVSLADDVSINFRDAEIRSAVESVAEVTGKSFVLDPRVNGKLTIISPEPIDERLFYEVFVSSLQVNGFQAIEDGAVVRIVPFSQAFDIPSGPGGNTIESRVIQVNHVKAIDILPSLQPLVNNGAQVHAIEASNHIVVTDTKSNVDRIAEILSKLDSADQSDMEVVTMQHISTGEALHIINQMKALDQQRISIVEDELNNRIIVGGPSSERAKFRKLLSALDVPVNPQPGVEVIYLNHSDAEQMKNLLTSMLQSSTFNYQGGTSIATDGEEVNANSSSYIIEFDKGNNAIVIAAPESVASKLRSIVRQLDRPRDQVLIEAIVAEISEDKAKELSVQLSAIGRNGGYLTNYSSILSVLGGVTSSDDSLEELGAALNSSTGLSVAGADLNDEGNDGFFGLLQALQSDAETNILSTPSVVTLDNEEATLSVGQEVPFITGSYTTDASDSSSNPFQTIEREEVGIKLVVTPQVNEGNSVKMAIEQESSNLLASADMLGTADVVTATRKIQTNVVVGDGELLVLGGLIGEDYSRSESKVPFLGSIPVLGNLFKSRSRSANSSVLMIFIRPTVIQSNVIASDLSSERYRYLRQRQLLWDNLESTKAPSVIMDLDQQLNISPDNNQLVE